AKTPNTLDPRVPVRSRTQLLADAADVHVDPPVKAAQRPGDRLLRNLLLAHEAPGLGCEHIQQAKLRAGQIQGLSVPGRPTASRPKSELAGRHDTLTRRTCAGASLDPAQYRPDTGDKFTRCTRLGHVIVGTHVQTD